MLSSQVGAGPITFRLAHSCRNRMILGTWSSSATTPLQRRGYASVSRVVNTLLHQSGQSSTWAICVHGVGLPNSDPRNPYPCARANFGARYMRRLPIMD